MKNKKFFPEHELAPILISIITIILGVFIGEIQNKNGWVMMTISLVFIAILCIAITRIVITPITNQISNMSFENNSDLTILTERQLAKQEDDVEMKELWIITADLGFDADDSVFEEATENNIKRGTKYTYFIPQNKVTKSRIEQLKMLHGNSSNLQFVFLDDDFFFFAPNLDCVLHFYSSNRPNDGFIGLTLNYKRYYIKMSSELFHATYGNLFQHVEKGDSIL